MRPAIAVTTKLQTQLAVEPAFKAIVPIDLTKIFRGLGPLPAVVGTRGQTGLWDHVGARRVVELGDGSEASERLTAYHPPSHFAYRVSDFTGPLRQLITHAEGAWWFEDTPQGTEITWTYFFHPRRARTLVVRGVLAPMWRVYQQRALRDAIEAAENAGRRGV
jgi:hypothetical protein